jgi:hypothetical protein
LERREKREERREKREERREKREMAEVLWGGMRVASGCLICPLPSAILL